MANLDQLKVNISKKRKNISSAFCSVYCRTQPFHKKYQKLKEKLSVLDYRA